MYRRLSFHHDTPNTYVQITSLGIFNRAIPVEKQTLDSATESIKVLRHHLSESLKLRILNVQVPPGSPDNIRIAVLFSGGLDCTVLARIADDLLPLHYQIDLLNVAFENPRVIEAARSPATPKKQTNKTPDTTQVDGQITTTLERPLFDIDPYEICPDRETGRKAFEELHQVCPSRTWRFVAVCLLPVSYIP